MLRYGEPIDSHPLHRQLQTGITIENQGDFVPEYEEREAAVFVLVPWHLWEDLPWQERAAAVAHYRMHHLIQSHIDDAIESERRRQERRGRKNG